MPKVKDLLAVRNLPTLEFVPCFAFVAENQKETSVGTRVDALSHNVAAFYFSFVASVAKSDQKWKFFVHFGKSFLCVYWIMSLYDIFQNFPVFAWWFLVKNVR